MANREPSDEERVTPPTPSEYPPVTVPEQPEFESPDEFATEERLWPKGLLDEVHGAPPPPRWPVVVAAVLAGLVLILAAGAVVDFRLRASNTGLAEPAAEARQEPTTAAGRASTGAGAVSQPPMRERPAAEPSPGSAEPPAGVVAAKGSSTTAAPAKPARTVHRAARPKPAGGRSTWQREAGPDRGVPLDQVYVNGRGELVDAQGHPLRADTAQAHGATGH